MRLLIAFALVFTLPFAVLAVDYSGNCSISFQGSSTLHDFEGKGSCQPFTASENAGVMVIPELSVAVSGMDTDNSKRDKKMREMFDNETYPLISGSTGPVVLGAIRKALEESAESASEVVFQLKIRDIEKPITAVLTNVVDTGSAIIADLVFSFSLVDYQLKPPSVLGFIRVGDRVNVTASFSLDAR